MKLKFIPVNNNIDKAIAFANTLDNKFITENQRIIQKPFYMNTLDVVNQLKGEGWYIQGVSEDRDRKTRKITSNYVQLLNPNFPMNYKFGNKQEALVSLTVSNSTCGKKPIELQLGTMREVCSNGAIAKDVISQSKIHHNELSTMNFNKILGNLNNDCSILLDTFNELKTKVFTQKDMVSFAYKAAKLKFSDDKDIDLNEILKIHRVEDEGNDMWSVFNRVQENLSYNINNVKEDIRFNEKLYELISA